MSVDAAGSAMNVQLAVTSLRQAVQTEQVAAAALIQASNQAAQQAPQPAAPDAAPKTPGVGENVDLKA